MRSPLEREGGSLLGDHQRWQHRLEHQPGAPGGADGEVIDYSVGVSASWKALTGSVAYVNTDAPKALGYKEGVGADGAVIFTLGVSF